jgi:hypothetical protein
MVEWSSALCRRPDFRHGKAQLTALNLRVMDNAAPDERFMDWCRWPQLGSHW